VLTPVASVAWPFGAQMSKRAVSTTSIKRSILASPKTHDPASLHDVKRPESLNATVRHCKRFIAITAAPVTWVIEFYSRDHYGKRTRSSLTDMT